MSQSLPVRVDLLQPFTRHRLPVHGLHKVCQLEPTWKGPVSRAQRMYFIYTFNNRARQFEITYYNPLLDIVSLHPPRLLLLNHHYHRFLRLLSAASWGGHGQSKGMSRSPPVGSNLLQPFTRHRLPPPWDPQTASVGTDMGMTSVT